MKTPTLAIVLVVALAACSGDDDALPEPSAASPSTTVAGSSADPSGSSGPSVTDRSDAPPTSPDPTTTASTGPSAPTTIGSAAFATTALATIAEVGVPGLASDDAFCAAWSRFGGSFQVIAVTAAFGSADVAALEVVAAPVAVAAYEAMLAAWPDELADERAAVDDDRFGPYARRWQVALDALGAAGAEAALIATIEAAWIDALESRDPSTPDVTVDLPDATWSVVDAAAAEFMAARVPFDQDPSLGSAVTTPATDAYLAANCPDQGTLTGQEVGTP